MVILQEHYIISHNWNGVGYLGMDKDRDYSCNKLQLSMLSYVQDILKPF